jgi:hypothetical protein
MKRFVQAEDRSQGVLLPEHLDDYVGVDNPVRVVDVFVEHLDLRKLGFEGVDPQATGRPASHPLFCSSSTSTAISTGFNQAVAWSGKRNATLN